jgi:hypothetical protein
MGAEGIGRAKSGRRQTPIGGPNARGLTPSAPITSLRFVNAIRPRGEGIV